MRFMVDGERIAVGFPQQRIALGKRAALMKQLMVSSKIMGIYGDLW